MEPGPGALISYGEAFQQLGYLAFVLVFGWVIKKLYEKDAQQSKTLIETQKEEIKLLSADKQNLNDRLLAMATKQGENTAKQLSNNELLLRAMQKPGD